MYPLSDGLFAPRNQWYVAAWSSEVTTAPMERWILDLPVALYRASDGRAVALEGRCPHRHFPLGKSRLVGDNIECGYHGLTFSPSGECVRIPTQVQVPTACKIAAYPVVEKWKWIWIWMGDPALADPALIPDHDEMGLTSGQFETVGDVYYHVPGRYMLMHDNLLDLSHVSYLHQTTIASGGIGEAVEERSEGVNWIRSVRHLRDVDCPVYFTAAFNYDGRIDRTLDMTSRLPSVHNGVDVFRKASTTPGAPGEYLGSVTVYHAVTPGHQRDAHYFFALGRDFSVGDAAFSAAMMDGIRTTLDEDMLATREVEAMITGLGAAPKEVLLRADAHCVRGRRLMEELIRSESHSRTASRATAETDAR